MSEFDGKTQPGTVLHAAVAFLKTQEQGAELATAVLAEGIGQPTQRIGQFLMPGVRSGLLNRRIEGNFAFWSLGPISCRAVPPSAPPAAARDAETLRTTSALASPSVFAYAQARAAAPFSCSLSTDGRLTAERHGRVIAEFTSDERKVLLASAECVQA